MNEIGRLPITIIRGNNKTYKLSFFNEESDGTEVAIDLTTYDSIRLDVKKTSSVNELAFLSLSIGSGLTISGDDNNILEIEFDREFITVNEDNYRYDILFEKDAIFTTFIEGSLSIKNVITL